VVHIGDIITYRIIALLTPYLRRRHKLFWPNRNLLQGFTHQTRAHQEPDGLSCRRNADAVTTRNRMSRRMTNAQAQCT
jgi:hypothetical protein